MFNILDRVNEDNSIHNMGVQVYKTYPKRTYKGKICPVIYSPPCENVKTKYAFTCKGCEFLLGTSKNKYGDIGEIMYSYNHEKSVSSYTSFYKQFFEKQEGV